MAITTTSERMLTFFALGLVSNDFLGLTQELFFYLVIDNQKYYLGGKYTCVDNLYPLISALFGQRPRQGTKSYRMEKSVRPYVRPPRL